MAYYLHHIINFNSNITENVFIELYKKDETISEVTKLKCDYCNKKYPNGQGDGFDTIISCELTIGLWFNVNDIVDADDFIVSFHDTWKVILKVDNQIDFVGFLVPNECSRELRDKPHSLELIATDGLGYLKSIPLTYIDGNNFDGQSEIIKYIAGALKKTNLDLNIRTYTNIVAAGMDDRNANSSKDTFNQAFLEYRTFLKDAILFTDCYNALEIILNEGYSLFQWFGKWVIIRLGELQENDGPQLWYTEYNSDHGFINAELETFSSMRVQKQTTIHPINADQKKISNFAIKSSKTSFTYTPWPEIPKNSKFERGSILLPLGGPDSTAYKISNWTKGIYHSGFGDFSELVINNFYRLSTYNTFGVETDRTIIAETWNGDNTVEHFILLAEPIPVKQGAKISVSLQKRYDNDFSGDVSYAMGMTLHGLSGKKYICDNFYGTIPNPYPKWSDGPDGDSKLNFRPFLLLNNSAGIDSREWISFNGDTQALPEDGMLYVFLEGSGPSSVKGSRQYYKDFNFEYKPYIAGGYIPVNGDYWFTSQNSDYKDINESEVFISDLNDKILKGAILYSDGSLTGKTWHRLNVSENRDFKELINIARYNRAYRRTWKVTGTFGGTSFVPDNRPTYRFPLGFHKHFHFPDVTSLNGYKFQLVPPLTIDYKEGTIDANFVDCLKDGANDGNQLGDTHEFKFVFKTN